MAVVQEEWIQEAEDTEGLSKEQMAVRDVFTGCADFVEENEYPGSIAQCVDKSIISEEEDTFHLTKLGKKAQKRGESFKVHIDGTVMRVDKTD